MISKNVKLYFSNDDCGGLHTLLLKESYEFAIRKAQYDFEKTSLNVLKTRKSIVVISNNINF